MGSHGASRRRVSAKVPRELRREWNAAIERRGRRKADALAAALRVFCRADARNQILLYHDAYARYYANGCAEQRRVLGAAVPAEIARDLTETARALGLDKTRIIAAAASAFAHVPDDVAARLAGGAHTCPGN